ncbi:short-subunit dehydrogenase [Oikeobacillus pervagus]|uniref:Short-subunit dehydrogenase n=1 Tax=Oikeobacillus pervagus TaxID=1325931 RepID=A0AAJ1WHX9_9BACI|nr:short-subunit dehydrogenase [Oikeobacillus pervagus]
MNKRLKGKNIVITGASGGIGEQMALKAAQNGANIALLARREPNLLAIQHRIEQQFSVRVLVFSVDISKRAEVEKAFTAIFSKLGSVDVLVNNAGFGVFDEAHQASWKDIEGMFQVNVLGLISCTQFVIPHMKERGSGHIINIASQAGKLATPKSSVYAATKHAVLGFTNSVRMELSRDGIYVTAVNPGPIATNFFEIADQSGSYVKSIQKLMLDPEKVASTITKAMFTNKREINLPKWMNVGSVLYALFPRMVERVGKKAFFKK